MGISKMENQMENNMDDEMETALIYPTPSALNPKPSTLNPQPRAQNFSEGPIWKFLKLGGGSLKDPWRRYVYMYINKNIYIYIDEL